MSGTAPRNYGVQALLDFAERAAHLSPDELVKQAQESIQRFQAYYQAPSEANGWKCPTCGTAQKYQGWKNWETWNFALWMDNSEGDQSFMYAAVEEAGSVRKAAEYLKEYFNDSELCSLLGKSGIYSDLLQSGLDAIDWEEVADHFKPDEWGDADEAPDDDDDDDDDDDAATALRGFSAAFQEVVAADPDGPLARLARGDDDQDDDTPGQRALDAMDADGRGRDN